MHGNDVVASIIKLIRSGTLCPGQKIIINKISDILSISQTPVREALSKLSEDEIVLHRHGQGFFIPYYTENELRELYDFLYILLEASLLRIMNNSETDQIKTSLENTNLLKMIEDTTTWKYKDQSVSCMENIFTSVSKLSGNKFIASSMYSCVIKTSFFRHIEYCEKTRRFSVKNDVMTILDYIHKNNKRNIHRRIISSQNNKNRIINDIYKEYSVAVCKQIYIDQ